jgi:hypothetical protein
LPRAGCPTDGFVTGSTHAVSAGSDCVENHPRGLPGHRPSGSLFRSGSRMTQRDRGRHAATASRARLALPLAERPTGWRWCRPDAGHRSPWRGQGQPAIPVIDVSRTGHGDSTTVGADAPCVDEWIARRHRCPLPSASQSLRATRGTRKRQVLKIGPAGRIHRPATTSGGRGRWPCTNTTLDTRTTTPGPPTLRATIARGPSGAPLARQGRVRGVRRAAPSHWRPVARRTNSSKARSNGGRPWQQHQL